MKNLILAIAFVLLAGCSLLNTSDFDNVEYGDFIDVMTFAEQAKPFCSVGGHDLVAQLMLMDAAAHHLENYTLHRINNENTLEIAEIVHNTTGEMVDRYSKGSASKIYCENKLDNIIAQAKLGADAVQTKVRR